MERAYILRVKPFRDNQYLVNMLAEDSGHVAAIIRASSRKNSAVSAADLQLFQSVLVSFKGKQELKRVDYFEPEACSSSLPMEYKLAGFYANELMLRLVKPSEIASDVYPSYQQLMQDFQQNIPLRSCLRYFEYELLDHLGILPSFSCDATNQLINNDAFYLSHVDRQFCLDVNQSNDAYSGGLLQRLEHKNLSSHDWLDAQRLMRSFLTPVLGEKPLASRALMRQYQGEGS